MANTKDVAEAALGSAYAPRTTPVPEAQGGGGFYRARGILLPHDPEKKYGNELDAERRERERQEAQQFLADQKAAREATEALEQYRRETLRQWRLAGGNEESFSEAWPAIREKYLLSKIGLE